MIRKLRVRLVAAAMLSLVAVLTVILGVILVSSYQGLLSDTDRILTLLAENQGEFPKLEADFDWENRGPRHHSPELGYETRYFSVLLDENGQAVEANTGKIAAVDEAAAAEYAQAVWAQGDERGFFRDYRYRTVSEGEDTRVIFLDYSNQFFYFRHMVRTSVLVAGVGLAAVLLLILLLSGRIIKPVSESYEKQKRFITDAGHELKTPIAIIQADAEVLALEGEENEWLRDIRQQTKRLSALTNDLVYLSRMEEDPDRLPFLPLPFSELVAETAQAFQALAKGQNKTFTVDIQPMLTLAGEEKGLTQLVSILLDNALKYAPREGEISLTLTRQGRYLRLEVENTAEEISKELLENMFDRFYRGDASRSSRQGGHGIGLAIAKAVVQAHRGKITSWAKGDDRLAITVLLPVESHRNGPVKPWERRRDAQ